MFENDQLRYCILRLRDQLRSQQRSIDRKNATIKRRTARIAQLEIIADLAWEAVLAAGQCLMTPGGCQTHNWDDPCAVADLHKALIAMRPKEQPHA